MLAVDADLPMVFVSDLVSVVYEYLNLAFLLDATGISFGVKHFSRHGRALIRVTAAAGDVDAAISVASFRASRADWTRPEFRAAETAVEFSERRYP
ncbi:MAG TPA: hypothetical protein VHU82_02160 [Vicinamibacterales bacterium]|nr:hypothetical protein [Vicinamibacterales bacterium]